MDCNTFIVNYGQNGTNYTCHVSRTDPNLVVVELDLQEVKSQLFYSLAVPIPCLMVAIFYLVIAYKFIYVEKKEKEPYRPVASAAAGSAFSAFIDLRDNSEADQDVEKERQRKFLAQIQRTKWLAQHGKSGATGSTANSSSISGFSRSISSSSSNKSLDISKYGSVRLKELQEAHMTQLGSIEDSPEIELACVYYPVHLLNSRQSTFE